MSSFIPGFSYDSFGAYSLFKKKKKIHVIYMLLFVIIFFTILKICLKIRVRHVQCKNYYVKNSFLHTIFWKLFPHCFENKNKNFPTKQVKNNKIFFLKMIQCWIHFLRLDYKVKKYFEIVWPNICLSSKSSIRPILSKKKCKAHDKNLLFCFWKIGLELEVGSPIIFICIQSTPARLITGYKVQNKKKEKTS